jgi:hypothetical protein
VLSLSPDEARRARHASTDPTGRGQPVSDRTRPPGGPAAGLRVRLTVTPSAKWGVHTYDKYAKSGLVTILHIAKGFTYFFAYSAYCFTYFIAYSSYFISYSAYCIAYSAYENGYAHILHITIYIFCIFIVIFRIFDCLFCIFHYIFCIFVSLFCIFLSIFVLLRANRASSFIHHDDFTFIRGAVTEGRITAACVSVESW